MLKAAIFDMDGVIVDSHPIHKQAWRNLLLSLGVAVTDQQLEFVLDGRKREDILRFFLGNLSEAELRRYGAQKDIFFSQSVGQLQLIAGVREFITGLAAAGVHLAVATSARRSRAEAILERFALPPYFSAVVTGDDVADGKPDPLVFQTACRRLQGDPDSTLVIEDAVSGVMGARAAGMRCMGIAAGSRARLLCAAGALYIVPDFHGLKTETVFALMNGNLPITAAEFASATFGG
jgi:HAD superfamily hydrolase (TIGR01509 family)